MPEKTSDRKYSQAQTLFEWMLAQLPDLSLFQSIWTRGRTGAKQAGVSRGRELPCNRHDHRVVVFPQDLIEALRTFQKVLKYVLKISKLQ
jgi:hypothetical protein